MMNEKLSELSLKKMLQWDFTSCLQLLLPWEVVESPSLEMFKTCLATSLSNLIQLDLL